MKYIGNFKRAIVHNDAARGRSKENLLSVKKGGIARSLLREELRHKTARF